MKQQLNLCKAIEPDYIPGTGVQVQLLNIRKLDTHYHEKALELIFCLEGSVWGHIAHNHLHLNSGDLVTFDREDVHNVFADQDNLCLVVHLNLDHPDFSEDNLINTIYSCTTHPDFTRHPESVQLVCDMMLALMYEASSGHTDSTSTCENIRLNLVDILTRRFSWFSIEEWYAHEDLYNPDDEKYADRFRKILSYIMQHYREKITVSGLSDTIFLNPSYISSFLRRTTFHSLTEAVNYFRCFYAQKLLLQTDLPVGEISALSGFSSQKYFYKAFKYFWQTTPLQHRRQFAIYASQKEEYYTYSPSEAQSILKDYIADRQVLKAVRQV